MIKYIMISILISVFWGIIANTELGWLSWICSFLVAVCMSIAEWKYQNLIDRISKLEKKYTESENNNE